MSNLDRAAAGDARAEAAASFGKSLANLVPTAGGRQPPRTLPRGEKFALRRAVDLVFADSGWLVRRRVYRRLLDHARTTPAPSQVTRAQLVDVVARAIEAAGQARRDNDAAETRRATTEALAAIGWTYRASGSTSADPERVAARQLQSFYLGYLGVQLVNALAFSISMREGYPLAMFSGVLGGAAFFGNLFWFADWHDGTGIAAAVASHLTFVESSVERAAVAKAIEKFWFELEARLAQRDEWRAWVRGQPLRPGSKQIARDVREYLRYLTGVKSLDPVCSQLLAPGAVHSPFT